MSVQPIEKQKSPEGQNIRENLTGQQSVARETYSPERVGANATPSGERAAHAQGGVNVPPDHGLLPRPGTLDPERQHLQNGRTSDGPAAAGSDRMTPERPPAAKNGNSAVHFISPEQSKQQQITPDYILSADGQLVANPNKKEPNADGSTYIGVGTRNLNGPDVASAPTQAASSDGNIHLSQAQAQWAQGLAADWASRNPGQQMPGELQNMLAASAHPTSAPQGGDTYAAAGQARSANAGDSYAAATQTGSPADTFANTRAGGTQYDRSSIHPYEQPQRAGSDNQAGQRGGEMLSHESNVHPTQSHNGNFTWNSNAEHVKNFLQNEMHFNKAQVAGVMGNMAQENANFDPSKGGDHGNALGVFQHNGVRMAGLKHFAAQHGMAPNSLDAQLQYFKHEMQTSEHGAYNKLMKTHTPEQAARAFSKYYERPGHAALSNRISNSREIASRFLPGENDIKFANR